MTITSVCREKAARTLIDICDDGRKGDGRPASRAIYAVAAGARGSALSLFAWATGRQP